MEDNSVPPLPTRSSGSSSSSSSPPSSPSSSSSTTSVEPSVYEEVVKEPVWVNAMNDEMNSIHKNNTSELVPLPKGKQVIGVKWVYKVKYHADGSVECHKVRLVAKGFAQTPGVDYAETFALVDRLDTFKIILAIATQYKWPIF
ncbi:uncharacterized mitochondrial protein AtMg00820-like [Cryptomeria japonica]|uniref:uncharacterized mitochondrial protein AtMg00820-like n=1 Tax=Cryptomeria japonica TaxID=3369 RepID=UPI0027DA0E44|nr:uncharacterized mitochondrial protein AtMg00820-like [Cryptomeria japonica]